MVQGSCMPPSNVCVPVSVSAGKRNGPQGAGQWVSGMQAPSKAAGRRGCTGRHADRQRSKGSRVKDCQQRCAGSQAADSLHCMCKDEWGLSRVQGSFCGGMQAAVESRWGPVNCQQVAGRDDVMHGCVIVCQ